MWMHVVAEGGLFAGRAVFTSLQGLNVAIGATEKPADAMHVCFKCKKSRKKNKLVVCFRVACR